MDKHIPIATFQEALDKKYSITAMEHNETAEQAKSLLTTYKPIFLIFGYVTIIAIISALHYPYFNWMRGMNVFMAGFSWPFLFSRCLI